MKDVESNGREGGFSRVLLLNFASELPSDYRKISTESSYEKATAYMERGV